MSRCKEGQGFGTRRTFLYVEGQIRSPDAARPVAMDFVATGTPRFSASTSEGGERLGSVVKKRKKKMRKHKHKKLLKRSRIERRKRK